jgi:hypothetical protein
VIRGQSKIAVRIKSRLLRPLPFLSNLEGWGRADLVHILETVVTFELDRHGVESMYA